ncbi:MAG: sensor histidine kinase [bacterium]
MKDSSYIIFAGILFVVLFAVFGIILYFNMLSEVRIDSYSKADVLLGNLVNLSDNTFHNLLYYEECSDSDLRFISSDEFAALAGKEIVDSFLEQDHTDIFTADSFWVIKRDGLLQYASFRHINKEHAFLKSLTMSIVMFGFNAPTSLPEEIALKIKSHLSENRSYGFFETKSYLVNYKSSSPPLQNHRFTLIFYRLKSDVFSHINETTIMFVVLLILAVIIIAIFIIFYINAVANVVVLEEQKKKEIELLRLNRMLTMERLSESIVHNINNPLTNVKGYMQILLSKKPELLSDYKLDVVMKNLNFVIDQLKSILLKNRSDDDGERASIDINILIVSELEFLNQLITSKKIECRTEFDPAIPKINGNYNDFKMIFLNIVDNAVDAMIDSSVKNLFIRTQYFNRNIVVSVEDTGCGISDEIKDRILEIYFTTKTTTPSSNYERPVGTGIGLFSVLKLVQKYNGKIEVSSIPNKGSIFTIKFPLS